MSLDAIILAGGMGTRLREVVSDRPKVIADVDGRPFLSRLLDQLAAAAVESIVLSTGYMAEAVEHAIGTTYRGIPVQYSREPEPLGTAGGLRLALGHTKSDPILALNGDSFCAVDLAAFQEFHRAKGARATILLTRVEDMARFGRVNVDDNDAVTRFEEKGTSGGHGWINAGVYCLSREVLGGLREGEAVSLEREVFPALIGDGLYAHRGGGGFIDIGTPQSYGEAQKFFA